jgi:hypothetical protein
LCGWNQFPVDFSAFSIVLVASSFKLVVFGLLHLVLSLAQVLQCLDLQNSVFAGSSFSCVCWDFCASSGKILEVKKGEKASVIFGVLEYHILGDTIFG